MKQKVGNLILSILNVLVGILFLSQLYGSVGMPLLKLPAQSLFALKSDVNLMNIFLNCTMLIFSVFNFICLIQNIKNKKLAFWYAISMIVFVANISWYFEWTETSDGILLICPILTVLLMLINVYREFKSEKRLKIALLYILGIVLIIAFYVIYNNVLSFEMYLVVEKYLSIMWLAIAFIMQIIYNRKGEELIETSFRKIINLVLYAIIVPLLFLTMVFLEIKTIVKIHKLDAETFNYVSQINTNLQKETINSNDTLIRVCRNNKYGYINQNGKEVIPCSYDNVGSSIAIYGGKPRYFIAQKGDEYYVISKNGNILASYKGAPLPYWKNTDETIVGLKYMHEMNKDTNILTCIQYVFAVINASIAQNIGSSSYSYTSNYDGLTYDTTEEIECEKNFLEPVDTEEYLLNDNIAYRYKYNLKSGYTLYIDKTEDIDECTVQVCLNDKVVKRYNNINLLFSSEDSENSGKLLTYTSGDFPYIGLEKNEQGYFDKTNFNLISFTGNFQIRDVINDKMIVRFFDNNMETKDVICDKTGVILLEAKDVKSAKSGFIIKKENGKMVYVDNNLKAKTPEFDFIGNSYIKYLKNSFLICANMGNTQSEYILCDLSGNKLTNQVYQLIEINGDNDGDESNIIDYESYERNSILDAMYE